MYDNVKTCRFCKDMCSPGETGMGDDRDGYAVRYGKRASAHIQCAIKAKGVEWLAGLFTWQLERIPDREARKLGILDFLKAETERRSTLNATGRIRLNGGQTPPAN